MTSCGSTPVSRETLSLDNGYLTRSVSVEGGVLVTRSVNNKLADEVLTPAGSDEFRLRISQGTDTTGTDVVLTASDFVIEDFRRTDEGLVAKLTNQEHGLDVEVHYTLGAENPFTRKHLVLSAKQPITLEQVDLEVMEAPPDASQPYLLDDMNPEGPWNPGLGQPLYTTESATFWGVEFPSSRNVINNGELRCGYGWGRQLEPGKPYTTYKAVVGVADDPAFVADAFMDYIDATRARPMRLRIQYNSWFDFQQSVDADKFATSATTVHQELVEKRGVPPFDGYVIDDGWQNAHAAPPVWSVNDKFDSDFASTRALLEGFGSSLGLWLSPASLFGAAPMVPVLDQKGYATLDGFMSMTGPRYMPELKDRVVELIGQEVEFFKFDGLFGQIFERRFELNGRGCPAMPQLDTEGFSSKDPRLNDPKFAELKTYYLVAGTERLIEMFDAMGQANPEVSIVISNGAFVSPWWLQHVDVVWLNNALDEATGSSRTEELVFRDGAYYEMFAENNTQFPMGSLFNHEPKKMSTGESEEVFRSYLLMNMSRGTSFIELYTKPALLSSSDWDVLAEGLKWARDAFPTFKRVRMHGGDPRQGQTYGYSGWSDTRGYVSFHNPGDSAQSYSVVLDRALGVPPSSGPFKVSTPLPGSLKGLAESYAYGDTLSFELAPAEVRLIDFRAE